MAEIILTPPAADEFEVSVLGPGYGECIVVHLGHGEWLINDSCVDRNRRAAGLSYLDTLGVDVTQAVKVVVASHWDDDHVRGLGEVVDKCSQALFVCSNALGSDIFLQL